MEEALKSRFGRDVLRRRLGANEPSLVLAKGKAPESWQRYNRDPDGAVALMLLDEDYAVTVEALALSMRGRVPVAVVTGPVLVALERLMEEAQWAADPGPGGMVLRRSPPRFGSSVRDRTVAVVNGAGLTLQDEVDAQWDRIWEVAQDGAAGPRTVDLVVCSSLMAPVTGQGPVAVAHCACLAVQHATGGRERVLIDPSSLISHVADHSQSVMVLPRDLQCEGRA